MNTSSIFVSKMVLVLKGKDRMTNIKHNLDLVSEIENQILHLKKEEASFLGCSSRIHSFLVHYQINRLKNEKQWIDHHQSNKYFKLR